MRCPKKRSCQWRGCTTLNGVGSFDCGGEDGAHDNLRHGIQLTFIRKSTQEFLQHANCINLLFVVKLEYGRALFVSRLIRIDRDVTDEGQPKMG